MEDTSLTDFVGEDPDAPEPDSAAGEPGDEGVPGDADSPGCESRETEEPEPATVTASWSGAGATCEACGGTVRWRWHAEGSIVCEECLSW